MKSTAELLKTARIKAGKTQLAVAEYFGWESPQFVSNIENGKVNLPTERVTDYCKFVKLDTGDYVKAYLNEYKEAYIKKITGKKR